MKALYILPVLLLNSFLLAGQSINLKLASDIWPPFTDKLPNNAFAMALVSEALDRAHVEANTDILDFTDVINGIERGRYDGSAALWHSQEREKYLHFSDPYLENRLILVGLKGSDISAKDFSELAGKRIAVVESYAYGPLIESESHVVLVEGQSDQENLERLLLGDVDYMLVDALLIEYLMTYQQDDAARYLEIGTNTLLRLPLYFALRKDIPEAATIIRKFNEEIRKMMTDGTYNRILQLNWIASDVDGDGQAEMVMSGKKAGTTEPVNGYTLVSTSDQNAGASNRYYIKGKVYESWEQVPQKYKVSQTLVPNAERAGFGPVFVF